MSEFSPEPRLEPSPDTSSPVDAMATAPLAGPRSGAGLPKWLPYFLLAVVPAMLVGLIVYATAGNGGGGSDAAGVLDGFIRLGPSGGEGIESYAGNPPPGYPSDMPQYPGSKIIVSFLIRSDQGNSYFVVYQTSDATDKVLSYFQEHLDDDPWQVEVSQASPEFSGVQFTRPDDADVQGDVSVNRSEIDNRTSIYVSYQDLTPSSRQAPPPDEFVLPASRALPPGFPNDVPIFKGKDTTTVTTTYFERGQGATSFYVSFLTKDSQDDVIDFYRAEFEKRGWTVTDSASSSLSSFELSIDFKDGPRQELQGSVRADSFAEDADYTKVDLLLEVVASRGRGN